MKPGIYPDLSMDDYHTGNGVSSTELKPILDTPARFLHERSTRRPDTQALEVGTVLHEAILTPDALENEYRFYDAHKTRCKTYWKWAQKNHSIGLFADDLELVQGARESLASHDIVRGGILSEGRSEWSYFAVIDGVLCKVRPDYHIEDEDGFIVIDLKSARKGFARDRRWTHEVAKRGYDFSAAMYTRVMEAATGKPVKAYLYLVIEKEPPYLCAFHQMSGEYLEVGHALFRRALDTLKKLEAGELDCLGYGNQITTIHPPDWRAAEAVQ